MREGAIIDLGDDWDTGDPPALERPVDPVRRKRTVLATMLAALAAATLMGAIPGRGSTSTVNELAFFPYPGTRGAVAIAGELVLVSNGGGNLTAYEHNGKVRWRAKLDELVSVISMYHIDGLILVSADRGLEDTVATIAYDPQTGRQVWRRAGALEPTDDYAVLRYGESQLTVFSATNLNRWWALSDVLAHAVRPDGRGILVLNKNGDLQERELATGAPRMSRKLLLPNNFHGRITLSRDRIVVAGRAGGALEERHWFDAETLAPAAADIYWSEWSDCGAVWCGRVRGSPLATIVDKSSGLPLRVLPEGNSAMGTPAGLLMLVYRSEGEFTAVEVVDPITGRRRIELGGWHTVAENVSGELTSLLVWPSNGGSHVGELRYGGLRVLGRVAHEVLGCRSERSLLLCWTTEGKLGLWSINMS